MLHFSKNHLLMSWKNFTLHPSKPKILPTAFKQRFKFKWVISLNKVYEQQSSCTCKVYEQWSGWLLRVRPKLCNIYIYIYMVHLKLIKNERSIGFDWLLQPYVNKKERCKKVAQFVGQPSHDIFFSLPKPRP